MKQFIIGGVIGFISHFLYKSGLFYSFSSASYTYDFWISGLSGSFLEGGLIVLLLYKCDLFNFRRHYSKYILFIVALIFYIFSRIIIYSIGITLAIPFSVWTQNIFIVNNELVRKKLSFYIFGLCGNLITAILYLIIFVLIFHMAKKIELLLIKKPVNV